MTEITWLGHGSWLVETAGHTLLVDPFLDDSPTAPVKPDQVSPDFILVSHGHADHISDCVRLARRTRATVVSNFEICQWLAKQGVANTVAHNLGGGSDHPWGRVKLTLAHHSSSLPDGSNGGNPSGFLLTLADGKIYFACDTGLFTMGPDDSIEAIKLIEPKRVAPSHFNTWPPIAQDVEAWAQRVRSETKAEPCVVAPGGKILL